MSKKGGSLVTCAPEVHNELLVLCPFPKKQVKGRVYRLPGLRFSEPIWARPLAGQSAPDQTHLKHF